MHIARNVDPRALRPTLIGLGILLILPAAMLSTIADSMDLTPIFWAAMMASAFICIMRVFSRQTQIWGTARSWTGAALRTCILTIIMMALDQYAYPQEHPGTFVEFLLHGASRMPMFAVLFWTVYLPIWGSDKTDPTS
jgi:hypothetical protein